MTETELQGIWAKVLRAVRESRQFALFGLLSTMNDIEFNDDQIFLPVYNDAEKNMLRQHCGELQTLAGEGVKLVLEDRTAVVADENQDYVTRLKDLFGDKVEISD